MKSFKEFSEHLPIATVCLIILGYINIYSYYHFFHIPIYVYLDPSEIIFSLTSILVELLYGGVFLFIYLFFSLMSHRKEIIEQQSEAKKVYFDGLPLFILVLIILVASGIVTLFITPMPSSIHLFAIFCVVVILPFFLIYEFFLRRDLIIKDFKFRWIVIITFFFFSYFIILVNINETEAIQRGSAKYKLELLLNDQSELKTSRELLYIGSTRNYYFFLDIKNNINRIIPRNLVKEERIRKIR